MEASYGEPTGSRVPMEDNTKEGMETIELGYRELVRLRHLGIK